jgi:hypothetical protein
MPSPNKNNPPVLTTKIVTPDLIRDSSGTESHSGCRLKAGMTG